ncbi:MAG: 50S ribosomal protein P1 [Candidatus Altiarchaeota archaeon]
MEYIYGVMLLHSVGKEINEENLKKVMNATGIEVDEAKVKAVISSLQGVNIDEAIKAATQFSFTQTAPQVSTTEAQKAEKKEEKKKEDTEKAEAEAATGLASLFG